MSQSGRYLSATTVPGPIGTITGNSGGPVGPDGVGNINVIGSGDISVIGNAGTNTLTITLAGTIADTFDADVGSAVPVLGVLNILGGLNIGTTGAGNTIAIHLAGTTNHTVQVGNAGGSLTSLAVGTNGQLLIGATGADPAFSTLTSTGGTITFTTGTHTLNLETSGATANSFPTDSGTATPSAGALTIHGGNNISTSGAASTVTINVSGTTNHAVQIGNAGGSLTSVAVGATNTVLLGNTGADPSFGTVPNAALANSSITLSNGNNITITGSPVALGGTATVNVSGTTNHALQLGNATGSLTSLGVASNGQLPIGSTGADPVLATLTAGTNVTITNGAGTITIAANATSASINYTAVNHAASPYTVLAADYYISADVTAGVISILLPNAPVTGRIFVVKDKVGLAGTSNITVTTVGGAVTIDGATSFVMNTAYESIQLIFNGVSYEVY